METQQVQLIIDELKSQNPEVSPGILRSAVQFAIRTGERSQAQDEATALVYPAIFFASVQSYLNGYAAYVDGDYNDDETALDPEVTDPMVVRSLMEFSEVLPSYMIARASHHVAVLEASQPESVSAILGHAVPAVAGNGFITGFSAAKLDRDNGAAVRSALPVPSDEDCEAAARWGVEAAGLDVSRSSSVVDAAAMRCHDMCRTKIQTRSGISRMEPDGARECMDVYALSYVNGLVNAFASGSFDKLSELECPEGMESAEAEVRAWCRQRRYPEDLIEATLSACRALHAESGSEHPDGGAFILTGWGYADGLAEMFDFSDSAEDAMADEIRKIFAAIGIK